MPHEDEIIKKLNENSPRKNKAEEVKSRWLEENPGKNIKDFNDYKYKQEWTAWETKTNKIIETNNDRWEIEKTNLPDMKEIDKTLKVDASFEEKKAKVNYDDLLNIFNDNLYYINLPQAIWYVPGDAETQIQWQQMLNRASQQIQINATELAKVVTITKQVATDEVKREKGDGAAVTEWQNSQLYKVLENMEISLKQWDSLLAKDAFPDKETLNQALDTIGKDFFEFYRAHGAKYGSGTLVPYVNFEVLATMKSLADKIASQFAARVGKPSFSGMYDLICDVPNRGSYEKGNLTANYINKENSFQTWVTYGNESHKSLRSN
jgi:hypothetical protein